MIVQNYKAHRESNLLPGMRFINILYYYYGFNSFCLSPQPSAAKNFQGQDNPLAVYNDAEILYSTSPNPSSFALSSDDKALKKHIPKALFLVFVTPNS